MTSGRVWRRETYAHLTKSVKQERRPLRRRSQRAALPGAIHGVRGYAPLTDWRPMRLDDEEPLYAEGAALFM